MTDQNRPAQGTGRGAVPEEALEALWQRFQPLVAQRLATVEAHLDGRCDREQARRAAHALAGALGSYGRPEGSRLAAELEAALLPTALGPTGNDRARDLLIQLHASVSTGTAVRQDRPPDRSSSAS